MKTVDMEMIVVCAVMAAAGALGILAGIAAFAGIRFQECSTALLIGTGGILWGVIWGVLLIFNSNKVSKRG